MDILKLFIRDERTGDCDLQLVALHEMLPYVAAAGHNHYTKSVYLYYISLLLSSKCYPYQLITLTFILCLLKGAMFYAEVTDTGHVISRY